MTVVLDLRPEIEARLIALATEHGMSVEQYVSQLLEGQPPGPRSLLPAGQAALWRDGAKRFPHTPPLSDEAISRESIYDARGWSGAGSRTIGDPLAFGGGKSLRRP